MMNIANPVRIRQVKNLGFRRERGICRVRPVYQRRYACADTTCAAASVQHLLAVRRNFFSPFTQHRLMVGQSVLNNTSVCSAIPMHACLCPAFATGIGIPRVHRCLFMPASRNHVNREDVPLRSTLWKLGQILTEQPQPGIMMDDCRPGSALHDLHWSTARNHSLLRVALYSVMNGVATSS